MASVIVFTTVIAVGAAIAVAFLEGDRLAFAAVAKRVEPAAAEPTVQEVESIESELRALREDRNRLQADLDRLSRESHETGASSLTPLLLEMSSIDWLTASRWAVGPQRWSQERDLIIPWTIGSAPRAGAAGAGADLVRSNLMIRSYLLLLAQLQYRMGDPHAALDYLEDARSFTAEDPIIEELRRELEAP